MRRGCRRSRRDGREREAPAAAQQAAKARSAAAKPAGAFDVAALDRGADPCVDFYEFACGGWRKATPIPPDQTRWGRFNELAERNREVLHQILERAKEPSPGRSPVEAKIGDYYAACMAEPQIEAQGRAPLEPLLAKVDALQTKTEFFQLLGENAGDALCRRSSASAPRPTCTTRPAPSRRWGRAG